MRSFFRAYDSFIFKAFDAFGRSSRADYWCVMPVMWAAILGLLWFDARSMWFTLEAGELPSLNPFAYGSMLFILISFIPRMTLSMRRLQDSGRKGKWVTLPIVAFFTAAMALVGVATSGLLVVDTDFADAMPLMFMINLGSVEGVVLSIFEVVSNIDNIHIVQNAPDAAGLATSLGSETASDSAIAPIAMLMVAGMIFGPPLIVLVYLLFMTMPSEMDENAYGLPSNCERRAARATKGEHNAFASYAILTQQGRKPSETELAARKETVHSLYEQRVLGRQ